MSSPSHPFLNFHHFGLAVKQKRMAEHFVTVLGYRVGDAVFDPIQNVNLALCTHETQPAVEIIWPGETSGPLAGLIQRHSSGIIYHVCYETDNLESALANFEAMGLRVICICPPYPAPLFGGRKVSFYNVVGIGLIEILE